MRIGLNVDKIFIPIAVCADALLLLRPRLLLLIASRLQDPCESMKDFLPPIPLNGLLISDPDPSNTPICTIFGAVGSAGPPKRLLSVEGHS